MPLCCTIILKKNRSVPRPTEKFSLQIFGELKNSIGIFGFPEKRSFSQDPRNPLDFSGRSWQPRQSVLLELTAHSGLTKDDAINRSAI